LSVKREPRNVADANFYKANPDALSDLDGLSRPPAQSLDRDNMYEGQRGYEWRTIVSNPKFGS